MPVNFSVPDPSVGIQSVIASPVATPLPNAQPLAATVVNTGGLEQLYQGGNIADITMNFLCPQVGDGHMVQPEVFFGTMQECAQQLAHSTEPALQALVEQELQPLLENKALLQAYVGLMIQG
ncbi:MAG: type III secretion protein [Desulfovibrionaceae bacterium]|nr:type III secretion protein [Desulfovibrionaceae bacterium]